ncbi:MAG: hypothetical protein J1E98_07030 [Lachnospiraceae bacterium]|nr:hypothetical protein [Lachnospiraceae bacterium]
MNYHVFIVDYTTFKYHLEYMFAGTGAGDKKVPFLYDSTENQTHSNTEINLVGMIADVSRIRIGDKIIFYLQYSGKNKGMFFGVFKAASRAFFDENDNDNYLKSNLNKSLTFRIRIAPDKVYSKGISEYCCLDSLEGIEHPYEMCWSLIYRKLKGNRGCTMITEYEFNKIVEKLDCENNGEHFGNDIHKFTSEFNGSACNINSMKGKAEYSGRKDSLCIKDRLLFKADNGNSFEVHLQALIMQCFDSEPLKSLLLPMPEEQCWIGNEVSCGVGMQRIDILIKQEKDNEVYLKIIELKSVKPKEYILEWQIPRYVQWISDYVVPNYTMDGKKVNIIPCIIALDTDNQDFLDKCRQFRFNGITNNIFNLMPLEYIAVEIIDNNVNFIKRLP